MKWNCPACKGAGGETEIIDPEIGGPWYDCGFCKGEGVFTKKKDFYMTLGYVSWFKRTKRNK